VQNALRVVVALALAAHGVGHAVGFGVAAPLWFAALWLVPGLGIVVAAWGFWKRLPWWQDLALASGAASLVLETIVGVSLQPGPYASAAVFNALAVILLLVPQTRRRLAHV
jgi:hypothetical protein